MDQGTINALMAAVEQKLREGADEFVVLMSSLGGSVFHGLSAYNFLKGIPAAVTTHNFGSVDSIGVVLFCAGTRRFSVPHARFLLHAVQANFSQGASLEEQQLEERLKGLRIDIENIAGVIAANTGRSEEAVTQDMLNRTTLESRAGGRLRPRARDQGAAATLGRRTGLYRPRVARARPRAGVDGRRPPRLPFSRREKDTYDDIDTPFS